MNRFRTYLVDVHFDMRCTIPVKAVNEKSACELAENMSLNLKPDKCELDNIFSEVCDVDEKDFNENDFIEALTDIAMLKKRLNYTTSYDRKTLRNAAKEFIAQFECDMTDFDKMSMEDISFGIYKMADEIKMREVE